MHIWAYLGVDFKLTNKATWGGNTSFLSSTLEHSESDEVTLSHRAVFWIRYNLFLNGPAF